jgi:hypothetical protein
VLFLAAIEPPLSPPAICCGLAKQTFAAPVGGVTERWIREQIRLPSVIATQVTVKNNDDVIKLVAEGKADAFFSERTVLKNHIANDYPNGELMGRPCLVSYPAFESTPPPVPD